MKKVLLCLWLLLGSMSALWAASASHDKEPSTPSTLAQLFTSPDAKPARYRKVRLANVGFENRYASSFEGSYYASYTAPLCLSDARQLWALLGTADAFRLYNIESRQYVKATAHDQSIALTPQASEAATFVLDDYTHTAKGGYALRLSTAQRGGDALHMNGGRGLLYWDSNEQTAGSLWTLYPADLEVSVKVKRGRTANPYPSTNTRMGLITATYGAHTSQTICQEGQTRVTLYLTKGIPSELTATAPFYGWRLQSTAQLDPKHPSVTFDAVVDNKYQYLWNYHPEYEHYFRIPALTTTRTGDLVALSDYRECHGDIGFGRVDQGMRYSTDHGKTWSPAQLIAQGDERANGFYKGFGDPCLVADRESDCLLLITVAGDHFYGWGDTQYWAGKKLRFARFYSHDGGRTWSQPEEITDPIYRLFSSDATDPDHVDKAFMGSGRIFQSRVTKVGSHYRLYAALCAAPGGNRVIYSDDFGKTWAVLGGKEARPAPHGDEPKCEELPNGDVILSSRKFYGRYYNLFRFSAPPTAQRPAEGTWDTPTASHEVAGGISVGANATNGEIMVVKAIRHSDQRERTLVLQSLPFGNNRSQVGLYWKDITSPATYQVGGKSDVTTFCQHWTRGLQVHRDHGTGSAYSTMTLQANGEVGFFYEEQEPRVYSMIYLPLTISEITHGAYDRIVVH